MIKGWARSSPRSQARAVDNAPLELSAFRRSGRAAGAGRRGERTGASQGLTGRGRSPRSGSSRCRDALCMVHRQAVMHLRSTAAADRSTGLRSTARTGRLRSASRPGAPFQLSIRAWVRGLSRLNSRPRRRSRGRVAGGLVEAAAGGRAGLSTIDQAAAVPVLDQNPGADERYLRGNGSAPHFLAAENSRCMASAPVVSASRSSRRLTTSVVRLELCPARRAISSTGTPEPGLLLIAGRRGVPYSGRSGNDTLSVMLVFLRRPAGLQVARASTP